MKCRDSDQRADLGVVGHIDIGTTQRDEPDLVLRALDQPVFGVEAVDADDRQVEAAVADRLEYFVGARNVPSAPIRRFFRLTAIGRLHMFRALPAGVLRTAESESVAQPVEQLTFNQ
jgi:hypothetical protein